MESLWFGNTSNAAGTYFDRMNYFNQFNFYFGHDGGSFKRTQSGLDDMKIGFNADGGGINESIGGIFLWGKFDYYRNKVKGSRFNASLIDPFRGSSFYIADPDAGEWLNHKYDLEFKVSTRPLFDFMTVGANVAFQSDMASKQVDARGNFYAATLEVRPGVAFNFGNNIFGLNFEYIKRKENSQPGLSVSMTTLGVAEMQFPGFFKRNEMGSINGGPVTMRDLRSHSLGGGVQYNYDGGCFKLLLSGNYAMMVEAAYMSYTSNHQAGSNIFTSYNGKLNAIYKFSSYSSLHLNAEYSHRNNETVGITQEYDNSEDVRQYITLDRSRRGNQIEDNAWASLEYMDTHHSGNSYSWLAGVKGRYEMLSMEYYIPVSTEEVNSLYMDAYVKKNFIFNDRNSLVFGLNGGIKNVMDNSHEWQAYYPENIFYKEFTLVDYAFRSTGYMKGGAELSYNYSGVFKGKGSVYMNATVDYVKPRKSQSELFGSRTFFSVKLGMAF